MLTLLFAALVQAPAPLAARAPIDFASIPRRLEKVPAFVARPRYGLFLFGGKGEVRVWAVLDKSSARAEDYDVLYLDRDGDGDLTEADERFSASPPEDSRLDGKPGKTFLIGDFRPAGADQAHVDFRITAREERVSYRMKWRGGKQTQGGYAPQPRGYADFSPTLEEAPIFVPGFDLPLQFEHWMSGELARGRDNDFKVFLGNRGSGKGTFSCGDDKFLEKDEHVVATLVYENAASERVEKRFDLRDRC